jgi:transcriptional regulator with XRE-family HTH domain
MTIYERIRALREELGLTQEELAQKVGYRSRSSINKIEAGQRDINQSQIKDFADALGVSPAYLMGWTDEKVEKDEDKEETLDDQIHTIAAHAERPLTDEEIEEVMEYAKYIIAKHGKKKK